MLGAKTATFAAVVALALGQANADKAAHLHVRVHTKASVTCPTGQESIGVAGWSSDGCVASGNVCVANTNGDCPTGAHCEWLDTGVYGCANGAATSSWAGCAANEQTIGVVGWTHDGCISSSNVCVAQVSNGDCPSGSACQKLDTGVYGCVSTSKKKRRHHHKSATNSTATTCPSGQESIGVAGWSSDGCVASGNVCVANTNGDCPSGAHCEWLDTGVYGCADGEASSGSWAGCAANEQTIGVVGWTHDGCISSSNVCVAQVSTGDCPSGAYCSLLDTGVYGCVASSKKQLKKSHDKASVTCPSGQESIGVAGWSTDGCVTSGNVCVANTDGDCPSGAHCEWLDTGVYGCADGAASSGSWAGCAANEQTIGVVGWTHDGCISSSNVCVAQVSTGDCPSGAYCSLLDTGVYGCVASSKKHHHRRHHHHKSATNSTSSVTCPSGQESIGVAGWSSDGCVASGNVCVANTDGDCPSGAHCEWLDTGVYGCADGEASSGSWAGCAANEQTIGVVGWTHDGCISSSNVCVAQVSTGDCPSGAYCSLLDTGVYGCVASSKH